MVCEGRAQQDETQNERLVADCCDESAHKRIDRSDDVPGPDNCVGNGGAHGAAICLLGPIVSSRSDAVQNYLQCTGCSSLTTGTSVVKDMRAAVLV